MLESYVRWTRQYKKIVFGNLTKGYESSKKLIQVRYLKIFHRENLGWRKLFLFLPNSSDLPRLEFSLLRNFRSRLVLRPLLEKVSSSTQLSANSGVSLSLKILVVAIRLWHPGKRIRSQSRESTLVRSPEWKYPVKLIVDSWSRS